MIALLLGCHHPEREPEPPARSDLVTLAQDAGFTAQTGKLEVADYGDCCTPGVSCLWNNPSTPYLLYALPPRDGESTAIDPDGWSRAFHLRSDEALVMLGRTPPEAKYFSLRSYLEYRSGPVGLQPILGSLGPSLNNLVVQAQIGEESVWDRPFAVVTTADAALERKVVGWLSATGWDERDVFVDRIPYAMVRMGLAPDADWFGVVARVAVFADRPVGDAYVADTQSEVIRLTPSGPETPPVEPHPVQGLPDRGSGLTEEALRSHVDALQEAIVAAYPDHTSVVAESTDWDFPTYDCIAAGSCSGEIRDRYYARVPQFLLPNDHTFLVAFGPNHERAGKARYSNCSVNTIINQLGLATVESDVFPGTARTYLPNDPVVDDLYAVVVARDCAPFPGQPCVEVSTGCPGVDYAEPLMVDFRAYLEPATGAAPLGTELVRDRAILFTLPP